MKTYSQSMYWKANEKGFIKGNITEILDGEVLLALDTSNEDEFIEALGKILTQDTPLEIENTTNNKKERR